MLLSDTSPLLSPHNSHAGSPALDEDDEDNSDDDRITPPPAPKAVSAVLKHKSLADSVADIANGERANHSKIAESLAKEKTIRSTEREKVKRGATVQVEIARMEHQEREFAAQRAHDIAMFNWQMELEKFRAARSGPSAGPPSGNQLDLMLWNR